MQVAMKSSAPPFFNHFSLSLNRRKPVVIRATTKKLNISLDSLHIRMSIYYILEFQPRLVRMRKWQKQSDRNRLTLLQRGECNAYCYG